MNHNETWPTSTERVLAGRDTSTLHRRFNNPARRHALSVDMWEALPSLLVQAEADERSAMGDHAPLTSAAAKVITAEILKASPDADLEHCPSLIRGCCASEDYAEGRQAFMQKHRPVFTGR